MCFSFSWESIFCVCNLWPTLENSNSQIDFKLESNIYIILYYYSRLFYSRLLLLIK